MSFIPCTNDCKYQNEGLCELKIGEIGISQCSASDCIHYVPKTAPEYNDIENREQ